MPVFFYMKKFRDFVNLSLLFSFLTLAGSGVVRFFAPFDISLTRIHIVFGHSGTRVGGTASGHPVLVFSSVYEALSIILWRRKVAPHKSVGCCSAIVVVLWAGSNFRLVAFSKTDRAWL